MAVSVPAGLRARRGQRRPVHRPRGCRRADRPALVHRPVTVEVTANRAERLRARPTAGCIVTRCERLEHESALTSRPGHAQPQLPASHDTCRTSPYRPLIHARQPRPGATPAARRPSAPRTQPMMEKPRNQTQRPYERPGTVGSSSHRHRCARTRGSAPAERRINRTQALRSAPAARPAAGHARPGLHPVLPSPAPREAARGHDQHKLTQRMPGR